MPGGKNFKGPSVAVRSFEEYQEETGLHGPRKTREAKEGKAEEEAEPVISDVNPSTLFFERIDNFLFPRMVKRLQRKWAKLMEGGITTKRKRNDGTKVVIGGEFPYYTATELEDNLKASIVTALKMRLNPKEYNASGKVVQSLKKEHDALKLGNAKESEEAQVVQRFGAWARKYDLNCKLVKHVNDKKKTVQYRVQPYQSWFRDQFREFELQKGSNEVLYDIKEYGGTRLYVKFTKESRAAVHKQLDDKISKAKTDEAKAELHDEALATAKSRAK